MISKELLENILGDSYRERLVDVIVFEDNVLQTLYDCGSGKPTCLGMEINIYELAHKCKEWAYNINIGIVDKYNYYIWSGINHNGKWNVFATEFKSFCDFTPCVEQNVLPFFHEDSEPEAIFKACQWILDNK